MTMNTKLDHSPGNEIESRIYQTSIRDEVYHVLRRGILDHKYPAGYRFDLPLLEKQLGVSRTPIRAALHRLEAEGLIEIRPQRGTFVTRINTQEISEDFDIRRVLELYAVEIAVERASDQDIAALGELVDKMCSLMEHDDLQSVIEQHIALDYQFHARIVAISGSKRLEAVYEQVNLMTQLTRYQQIFALSDLEAANIEHKGIMLALRQRNLGSLVSTLDTHLKLSKVRMLARLQC